MTMKTELTRNHRSVSQVLDGGSLVLLARQAVRRSSRINGRELISSASDQKGQGAGALQRLRPVRCPGTRASVLECGSPLPLSERSRSKEKPCRAFSLIEMI